MFCIDLAGSKKTAGRSKSSRHSEKKEEKTAGYSRHAVPKGLGRRPTSSPAPKKKPAPRMQNTLLLLQSKPQTHGLGGIQ